MIQQIIQLRRSILFTFSQQNLNDTIQSSDITITTADSNSVTNFSFDNNDVSDGTVSLVVVYHILGKNYWWIKRS